MNTCTKCDKPVRAKGLCNYHYQLNRQKATPPCTIEGCDRNTYAKGLCWKHYDYARTHEGRVAPLPQPPCSVCGKDGYTSGLCKNHYQQRYYHGMVADPDKTFPNPPRTYEAAHGRVRALRGHAKIHGCVSCPNQATQWALKHDAEKIANNRPGTRMHGSFFSTRVEDYQPMCRDCHSAYDAKHDLRRHLAKRGPKGPRKHKKIEAQDTLRVAS